MAMVTANRPALRETLPPDGLSLRPTLLSPLLRRCLALLQPVQSSVQPPLGLQRELQRLPVDPWLAPVLHTC